MDDPTVQFLFSKRIQMLQKKHTLDPLYKDKIIGLTKQMMESPFEGPIQHAFDAYVSECMKHLTRVDIPYKEPPQTKYDKLLAKKINPFKKNKCNL